VKFVRSCRLQYKLLAKLVRTAGRRKPHIPRRKYTHRGCIQEACGEGRGGWVGGWGGIVNPRDVTLGSTQVFISGERKFEQGVHTRVCLLCSSRYRAFLTSRTTTCLRTASHLNWAIRNTVFVGIAQSVYGFRTGWTVRGSNAGGGFRFSVRVHTGPSQHTAQQLSCLYWG